MIEDGNKINLYKNKKKAQMELHLLIVFSMIIKIKTLPLGMDLSTKLILNTAKLHLNLLSKKHLKLLN